MYHVMVAGSLLGVTLGKGESFPVGKVDMLSMYPMDYEEFLYATGHEGWIDILHSKDWTLIETMMPKMVELLRQYYFVGGMPGVVSKFVKMQTCNKYVHCSMKYWKPMAETFLNTPPQVSLSEFAK